MTLNQEQRNPFHFLFSLVKDLFVYGWFPNTQVQLLVKSEILRPQSGKWTNRHASFQPEHYQTERTDSINVYLPFPMLTYQQLYIRINFLSGWLVHCDLIFWFLAFQWVLSHKRQTSCKQCKVLSEYGNLQLSTFCRKENDCDT